MSVKINEIVGFTQQLSSMVQAGIPITNCLTALANQEENPELEEVIFAVASDVEDGDLFSDALARHPKIFGHLYVSMIYAGEQGAGLGFVLDQITEFLEKNEAIRQKVKSAYMYPLIVGSFGMMVILFLIAFIVPVFSKVYTQMDLDLPLPTTMLLIASAAIRGYWWVSLAAGIGLFIMHRKFKKDDRFVEMMEWLTMNMPVWGKLSRQIAVSRFIRSFSNMLMCHVSMMEALTIADRVSHNRFMSKVIKRIRNCLKSGGRITDVISEVEAFPPVIVQMTYAGEESGRLGELLAKCSIALDQSIDQSTKKILMVIEPVFTVAMAGIVGFIALSIYLPMFDLMKVASH